MQYPNLKFHPNVPVRVTFKYGDCKFSDGNLPDGRKFDPSYQYGVSAAYNDPTTGNDVSLEMANMRATELLHGHIVDSGAGQGAIVDICKRTNPETQRSFFEVIMVQQPLQPGIDVKDWGGAVLRQDKPGEGVATPAQQQASQAPQGAPAGIPGTQAAQRQASKEIDGSVAIDAMSNLYQFCWLTSAAMFVRIKEAEPELLAELGVTPDIQTVTTVATSFFISADRQRMTVAAIRALAGDGGTPTVGSAAMADAIDKVEAAGLGEGGSSPEDDDDLPF